MSNILVPHIASTQSWPGGTIAGSLAIQGNLTLPKTSGYRIKVTTLPTITAGSLFIHTADLHYQSTGAPTKQKAPNFYV